MIMLEPHGVACLQVPAEWHGEAYMRVREHAKCAGGHVHSKAMTHREWTAR